MRYTAKFQREPAFWAILAGVLLANFLPHAPALRAAATDSSPITPGPTDWPWWRGLRQDNISTESQEPPTRWGTNENILWKTEIPGRGYASPTLWGDRIFLPTADEEKQVQYMLCLDRKSGRKLWQTEAHRGGFRKIHVKNSHATATPACDGQRLYMPFMVQDGLWLTAFDLEGKIIWQKRLGDFRTLHGFAASPLLYKSLVIVLADQAKGSFVIAVQRGTGETVWRTERPSFKLGTYASPTLAHVAGRDQLLVQCPNKVFSYNPADGRLLWMCAGATDQGTSNVIYDQERVYASAGYPQKYLLCIRADGNGDVSKTHLVWRKDANCAYVPTPLLADGLLYMVCDDGKTSCFEAKTGAPVWEERLRGPFSASPVLAGGHIYVVNEAGVMSVFKPGRKFELIAENDLSDGGFAMPIICGSRIYLRTQHHLYCLGKP